MNIPVIPYSVAAEAQVSITFSTAVAPSESRISGRKSYQDQAIRKYTVTIGPDDSAAVMAILLAVRGSRYALAIRDYTSYQLTDEPQTWTAETGGGVIDLHKSFVPSTGARSYSQRILIVDQVEEAFSVKVNGSPTVSGTWFLSDPGVLHVTGLTSGDIVTVTGEYLVPVCFTGDQIDVTMHTKTMFAINNVQLEEILEAELLNNE